MKNSPNQNNVEYVYRKYGITGIVQGVYYRQNTQEQATRLGLVGWVENQSNGEVFAWVKGPLSSMTQLENWLTVGSPKAVVVNVTVLNLTQEEIQKLDNSSDFTILR